MNLALTITAGWTTAAVLLAAGWATLTAPARRTRRTQADHELAA